MMDKICAKKISPEKEMDVKGEENENEDIH